MRKYIDIILGNLIVAFALNVLILDYGLVAGGVSGLSAVIHHYFNLPISMMVAVINMILFTIGYIFKGRDFARKTLLSSLLLPLFLECFNQLPWLHGWIQDPLLIALIGGGMIGAGTGLIINAKASGGGFDIIGILLNQYFHLNISFVACSFDLVIIMLQLPYHDATRVIYGLICIGCVALSMNAVISGVNRGIQVLVFSNKQETLKAALLQDLDVGLTLLHGSSGYLNQEVDVLLSVITIQKLPQFKNIVKTIDSEAFMITSQISEVSGNGFTTALRS